MKLAETEQQQKLAALETSNAKRMTVLESKIEMLVRAMAVGQVVAALPASE